MGGNSVLEIVAYGAWNGGTVVDNSLYEKKGLSFKGGVPVNNQTIEERMGVRTRKVAGTDERIGVMALQEDRLQGFKINANLDQLKEAKIILNYSVGAGMTRSSFLQKL